MIGDLAAVLATIRPGDRVLDAGGGLRPLSRADVILDANPMEELIEPIGEGPPRFTRDRWIVHDVNDKRGFPFPDQSFDFVFCSHLLEDVRDPIFVCQELQRVAQRGYIETPSRAWESQLNVQSSMFTGFMHHRWYVETVETASNRELRFTFKSPFIHEFPILHCHRSDLPKHNAFIFDGPFAAYEQLMYHPGQIAEDLVQAAAQWQPAAERDTFIARARRTVLPHEHRGERSITERVRSRASRTLHRIAQRTA